MQVWNLRLQRCHKIGVQIWIQFLNWTKLLIQYLSLLPIDKKVVIKEHIDAMGPHKIGEKSDTAETIIRACNYYTTSGATYDKLRHAWLQVD